MFEAEIKTALKAAGLSEDLWKQITVKSVDEITGAITQLKTDMAKKTNLTSDQFLEELKKAGLDEAYKKILQSETDRVATKAIQTHDEKLKKKAEEDAAKIKADEEATKNTMTDDQKQIKFLTEKLTEVNKKLEGITTKLSAGEKKTLIEAALKKAGLDNTFATNIVADNPEQIVEAVAKLKAGINAVEQTTINKKLENGELSSVKTGAAGKTLEESNIAEYAKNQGVDGITKNSDFQGKISSREP